MQPGLTGISETMLWTLHNRASEAARPDGCLCDPMCLHIYRALHYDYERHFGHADGSHGVCSQLFDEHLRIGSSGCSVLASLFSRSLVSPQTKVTTARRVSNQPGSLSPWSLLAMQPKML